MSLLNTIILTLSVVLLVIGIHQTMLYGLSASYWIFMFCVGLLLLYKYRKANDNGSGNSNA